MKRNKTNKRKAKKKSTIRAGLQRQEIMKDTLDYMRDCMAPLGVFANQLERPARMLGLRVAETGWTRVPDRFWRPMNDIACRPGKLVSLNTKLIL